MGNSWKELPLGELYDFRSGLSKPRSEFGFGYDFLSFKDVFYNIFVPEALNELVNSSEKEQKSCSIERGDVFLTRTSETMEELGMSSVALKDYPKATFNGFTKRLRPLPDTEIVPEYAAYFFRSSKFRSEVTAMSSLSTRASLNNEMLGRLKMVLPGIDEQTAIGSILKGFDNKIELNRQMNQTLEAMARAIFKSWFVDFDPVRENMKRKGAKAQGRKEDKNNSSASLRPCVSALPFHILDLFPDGFEVSELGEIPKGWAVKVLGEIATTALGGQWGEEKPGKGLVPAICLRGCDMEDLRNEGYAPKAPVRFIKENAIEKRLPRENDLLIAASGAGPCGRPLWCSSLIEQIYNEPVIYSNFVKRFSTSAPEYAVFLDRLFHEKFIDKSIQDFITGTSVPNLDSKGLIAGFRIVVPPKQILKVFYKQNQPIFEKLYSVENVVLSNLRDTLLPKLISGKLRVPDAEKFIEEAGL